jgi:hypothetical protein
MCVCLSMCVSVDVCVCLSVFLSVRLYVLALLNGSPPHLGNLGTFYESLHVAGVYLFVVHTCGREWAHRTLMCKFALSLDRFCPKDNV